MAGKKHKDGLTDRQRMFVNFYLIDFNATQAAIKAGYSRKGVKSTASKLLSNINVQKCLSVEVTKRLESVGVTAEQVITRLSALGFATLKEVATWTPNGVDLIPSEELTTEQAATVKRLTITTKPDGTTTTVLEQHDPNKALLTLAKYFGLLETEKQESTTPAVNIYLPDNGR